MAVAPPPLINRRPLTPSRSASLRCSVKSLGWSPGDGFLSAMCVCPTAIKWTRPFINNTDRQYEPRWHTVQAIRRLGSKLTRWGK